jgi:hypothetical protein
MSRITHLVIPFALSWLSLSAIPQVTAADSAATPAMVKPTEWLEAQPKPLFKTDHTLPRLTRYGFPFPYNLKVELAKNWGYALEFTGYLTAESIVQLDTPGTDEAKLAALAKSDPKNYSLSVTCSRKMPSHDEAPPEAWARDKEGKVLTGKAQSMDGTEWSEANGTIFSPEAPDSVWKAAGEFRAAPLREIQKRGIPISMVLNGGEYGLAVLGFAQQIWSLDPKIVAAVEKSPGGSWQDYTSSKKGNSEMLIADAVRAAVPKRQLYIYYSAGGGTLRNKDANINNWSPQWKHIKGVSDLPSNEIYYKHFNDGFTGRLNLLTIALNATANEIASGMPLSYNWVCGGWTRHDASQNIADIARWSGFLKCYYTAGMIGCNVGYYELPKDGHNTEFPANEPPLWLQQMVASSHIHAFFSHLEPMIRQSELLPGTLKNGISTEDPAYEIASGDPTVRVLARKHKTRAEWLITAWAADGGDREVTVEIPELGKLKLNARICGSVYRTVLKDQSVELRLLDEEGSTFTRPPTSKSITTPVN